jgi:hypothetical protein
MKDPVDAIRNAIQDLIDNYGAVDVRDVIDDMDYDGAFDEDEDED